MPPPTTTGRDVLDELLDLLIARLPSIPAEDPARPHLARLVPQLASALDRPAVVPLPAPRAHLTPTGKDL